jgi:crotonobetainyl-CoA:carnitine CoA-transferase CaiB-like acyl-CoA transferase
MIEATGPLKGLKILDLTRVLAGPTCTQLLADLGADVIKVENPKGGDDSRKFGPPYIKDGNGDDTSESAYFLACNRNKRSITLDLRNPKGAEIVKQLLKTCDAMVHNFKVGGLEKYGLGYEDIKDEFPSLVYCAISGYGQTGPYKNQGGYDMQAQGMAGIMAITGEVDGQPMKVGIGIADMMCGMYAAPAILAALRHRDATGDGQFIDLALLDTTVAWLNYVGLSYLTSGEPSARYGNGHPNIVPWEVFPSKDGHFVLTVGNDGQFKAFCEFAEHPELAENDDYATNAQRVRNREVLVPLLCEITRQHPSKHWLENLPGLGVVASPAYTVPEVFEDPQVLARGMKHEMEHPKSGTGKCTLIGNPINMSKTQLDYRITPPLLGQHTDEILEELLDMGSDDRQALRDNDVI